MYCRFAHNNIKLNQRTSHPFISLSLLVYIQVSVATGKTFMSSRRVCVTFLPQHASVALVWSFASRFKRTALLTFFCFTCIDSTFAVYLLSELLHIHIQMYARTQAKEILVIGLPLIFFSP